MDRSPILFRGTHPQTSAHSSRQQHPLFQERSSSASDQNDDFIIYNREYRVQICGFSDHGYAVRNLKQHLLQEHTLSKARRQAILAAHADDDCVRPDQVRTPPPFGPPISGLRAPVRAQKCAGHQCEITSKSVDGIRQHANKKHKWRKTKEHPDFWQMVYAQTFFVGRFTKYFAIQHKATIDTPADDGGNPQPAALSSQQSLSIAAREDLESIKAEWTTARQQHQQELERLDEEIMKQDRTGWWNRAGWLEHLAKRNLKYLAHTGRLPDRDEYILLEAVRLMNLLLARAVAGLSTLDLELRRWLKSPKQSEIDVRPQSRLQNTESQDRYCGYVQRFLCYVLRVWMSEQEQTRNGAMPTSSSATASASSHSSSTSSHASSGSEDETSGEDEDYESRDSTNIDIMKDARELFPWHGSQRALAGELHDLLIDNESEKSDHVLIQKMLEVFESFIFHKVGGQPFKSGLVHFLAILGIDEENNRLRRAVDYSYILAGVVYCMRVLGAEILLPSDQREEQERDESSRERFLEQRRNFLADGTGTPMSSMVSLLAYGKRIAMNTGNAGSVAWSRDKQTMFYRGHPIELVMFRRMMVDVLTRAEDLLWEKLMWVTHRPERFAVPLERIVDDVTFTRRGYSFISKSSNGLDLGLDWMLARMMALTGRDRLRVNGRWRRAAVRRWLRYADDLDELTLFSQHGDCGGVARGSEIAGMRFRNGCLQDRNYFIVDGLGMTVTRYHKSQALFDRPKVIPRFAPWRLTQVMVVKVAYVHQLREHLLVQLYGRGWSDHIWYDKNGPWETDRLTRIIKRETALALGHRFTTLDFRHIMVSIGRVVVGEPFAAGYKDEIGETEEPEVEEESALELQHGRGEAMGALRYAVPVDIINNISTRSIDTFREQSLAWHRFLGLDSYTTSRFTSTRANGIQASPGSQSKLLKRRASNELLPTRRPPPWRALFNADPQAQRLPSPLDSHQSSTSPSQPTEQLASSTELAPQQPSSAEIEGAMHRLLGKGPVAFQSPGQRDGVYAVLRNETPLVVVLPTGGGKTLLAMLAALLDPEGVIIFIAPFRALVNNMVQRFQRAGINCLEWRFGEVNRATVVVVSADIAVSYSFLSYAQLLVQKKFRLRVFLDEAHLAFTSIDFRGRLAELRQLRALNCPIIMQTATLPPMRAFELEEAMLVRCARYIRGSTVRPQHRYHVQRCRAGELRKQATEICQRRMAHLGRQKGVVYCCSRAGCESLAEELKCVHYHAGRVDRAEKLQEWLERGGLIVATSALGTGVDFPGIVFVLHVDMPWGMIDFAQESGRAGRGGEVVDSIVLVEEDSVERRLEQESMTLDRSAMAAFITAAHCRRHIMSEYLDGPDLAQACGDVAGGARCDRCGEGLVELQEGERQAAREWQMVKHALDDMAEGCAVCWVVGEEDEEFRHAPGECQRWAAMETSDLDRFRRQIRYTSNSHSCTRCGMSQKYCPTGQSTEAACPWPNVMVPVVRIPMGSAEGFSMLQKVGYAGEFQDWERYGGWLGQRHGRRVWGEWMSNGMAVLIEMILYALGVDR